MNMVRTSRIVSRKYGLELEDAIRITYLSPTECGVIDVRSIIGISIATCHYATIHTLLLY
jgi:hypothetical protein